VAGLGPTVAETRRLLVHASQRADTSTGMRDSVRILLSQDRDRSNTPAPGLQAFLFGAPTLVVAGERKQFSQRGRVRRMPEFLAYLLLKGQDGGCRWSEVSDSIWPDLDAEKSSISFHQTVKRLRDHIFGAPDYLIVQDDYYQIHPQYLEWCDALSFERLYERAAKLRPEDAVPLWQEIVALYAGEFLAGFEVGEWGSAYRALCETRFLQCVNLAAEQLLEQGAPQVALSVVDRGLAQDYFREDLHHCAMAAYAQLGLRDQVAKHYAEMSERFEQELGAPPDETTRQVYEQIMAHRSRRQA
jgi:two-component SAPR family response regulator